MIDVLGHIIWQGDALAVLKTIPDNSYGGCVTDTPYHLGEMRPASRGYPGGNDKTKALAKGFMGQEWDGGDIAFRVELWREVYRVLKPGAYLVAFSGSRSYHRMAAAIDDAGFLVTDMLHWCYGSGFPKRHDISKAFDKANGVKRGKTKIVGAHNNKGTADTRPYIERAKEVGYHEIDDNTPISDEAKQWHGWDRGLKPAHEPICLAQKPREGTYVENIRTWGVGGLNVKACRLPTAEQLQGPGANGGRKPYGEMLPDDAPNDGRHKQDFTQDDEGRYPPNMLMSHSLFCLPGACDPTCPIGRMDKQSGKTKSSAALRHNTAEAHNRTRSMGKSSGDWISAGHSDSGGASRYFPTLDYEDQDFWWFDYTPKPATKEKTAGTIDPDTGESSQTHVTVKPLSVMRWLLDLILPKGERAIDIFAGSGTTLCAAHQRRHLCDGIELLPEHVAIIRDRLNANTIKGWE